MAEVETIWDAWKAGAWVIVPTNTVTDSKGDAIMGAGVAREAAIRSPGLRQRYGRYINLFGDTVYFDMESRFICFPTKHAWFMPSPVELISTNSYRLAYAIKQMQPGANIRIVSPHLGCGKGSLSWDDVYPVVKHLKDVGVEFFPKE
jgi:hypothetical protein